MKHLFEVVRTFDVEPFYAGDGDAFRFRLEILKGVDGAAYSGKVYRLETFRIQPTFPQSEGTVPGWMSDALIFLVDETLDSAALTGNSVQEVLTKFQAELARIFDC